MTTLKTTDPIAENRVLTAQLIKANERISQLTNENEALKAKVQELEKPKKSRTPDMKNVFRR